MGLVFALQPDLRKSSNHQLVIGSSKKKFGLGGTFLFGAALLGTMYVAAAPLFKLLWTEGTLFDQILAALIFLPIPLYPLVSIGCWFFKEVVIITKQDLGYSLEAYNELFGYKWKHRQAKPFVWKNLYLENWKGSLNTAALEAQKKGQDNRYATKGHWMLKYRDSQMEPFTLERRARREEVEFLKTQMEAFFKITPEKSTQPQKSV